MLFSFEFFFVFDLGANANFVCVPVPFPLFGESERIKYSESLRDMTILSPERMYVLVLVSEVVAHASTINSPRKPRCEDTDSVLIEG
jgi:hypothetical protein